MGPEGNILVNSPISTFQQGLTHSALIYMRGVKSADLVAMIDFLYSGEANVDQENLDSFLAIAEELQLKGLRGTEEESKLKENKLPRQPVQMEPKQSYLREEKTPSSSFPSTKFEPVGNHSLALQTQAFFSGDLQQLDETVKSMMEASQNTIPNGRQQRDKICKVCGKEGRPTDIMRHIEANHLEGVSIPCNHCDKLFRSRNCLSQHVSKFHKQQ